MKQYNETCITKVASTITSLLGILSHEGAAEPITQVLETAGAIFGEKGCDRVFMYNPDAIGQWIYEKYQDYFKEMEAQMDLKLPMLSVMLSVTPVCFASMYTGMMPPKHGIMKYVKPVLKVDTVFDDMVRANKKAAIVSTEGDSISKIFLERAIDYFIYPTKEECNQKALELIEEDNYDLIVLYNGDYDSIMHDNGPEGELSLQALRENIETFMEVKSKIQQKWQDHNTTLVFAPDHGCHWTGPSEGKHGTDDPTDMNIVHFYNFMPSSPRHLLGADIGGTTCKLGLFDVSGKMLDKWEIPTDRSEEGKKVLPDVAASFRNRLKAWHISEEDVIGLGMGLPGTQDKDGFFACPNLNWNHVAAQKEMQKIMGSIKVKALNDANAAAYGEMWKGSAKGYENLVMVTLGTGVGGGIIIDGKLLCGVHGAAGEIGGIVVNPQETESFVGGPKGCLEQYASATGLVNMTQKRLAESHEPSILDEQEITAKAVFDACKDGDKLAEEIIDSYCDILGKGLARVSYIIDTDMYVIGGGVSKAGDLLIQKVQKAFLEDVQDISKETKFTLATLGNDAGMYGAVYAVLESLAD